MSEDIQIYNSKTVEGIETMQKLLNAHPDKSEVRVNKQAKNAEYLPINTIERKLDELYNGLWQTTNFRWEVVANEIIGSIDLKVFHPAAREWLTRTGCASAMIQTKSGQEISIASKYPNTLVKDFPHMKAECLKNAAKSLGVVFGRALNRGKDDDYTYLSETVATTVEGVAEAEQLLSSAILTENERQQVEAKIGRATPKTIKAIVEFLKSKQS